MDRVTMVMTNRFSDGSGGTKTVVGTRDELAQAFAKFVPSATSVRQGYTLTVQFFPAPGGDA